MKKTGLVMAWPEGKLPGYYTQILRDLAKLDLFDRDKEMLILHHDDAHKTATLGLLAGYNVEVESIELLLLPPASHLYKDFSDYGFTTPTENKYVYAELTAIFGFSGIPESDAELGHALLQMEEHLLARFQVNEKEYYVVDSHFKQLIEGIANAYRCSVEWLEG